MAILARYGNVQPNVYDEMDPDEAFELAERVAKMWRDDVEELMKAQIENTKAILKQIASRPSL
jgi:DNA-binding GntR family transcriptional regulator